MPACQCCGGSAPETAPTAACPIATGSPPLLWSRWTTANSSPTTTCTPTHLKTWTTTALRRPRSSPRPWRVGSPRKPRLPSSEPASFRGLAEAAATPSAASDADSADGHASVHGEHVAGDEAAARAEEEQDRLVKLARVPAAPERDLRGEPFGETVRVRAEFRVHLGGE